MTWSKCGDTKVVRTRLQQWLDTNHFTAAELERKISMARPSLNRIRRGSGVRLSTMLRVLRGCRALARRDVHMEEIFILDPDELPNGTCHSSEE